MMKLRKSVMEEYCLKTFEKESQKSDSQKSPRLQWIDICKGLAILLVILGHSISDGMKSQNAFFEYLYNIIYFFHMPLFMCVSGITFFISINKQNYSATKTIKKRMNSLLKPYLIYTLLVSLIVVLCFQINFLRSILMKAGYELITWQDFLLGLIVGDNEYCFHMWFIYVLFVITLIAIIANTIFQKIKKVKTKIIIFEVLFFILLLLNLFYPGTGYLIVDYTILNLFWFMFGIQIMIIGERIVKNKVFILLGLLGIALYFVTNYLNVNLYFFKNILYLIFKAFIIIGFISLSMLLNSNKIFIYLGQNCFGIYLFHQPFICAGTREILYTILSLNPFLVVIVTFIVSLVGALIINKIFKIRFLNKIFF